MRTTPKYEVQANNPKLKVSMLDKLKLTNGIKIQGSANKNMQDFKIFRNILLLAFLTSSYNLCSRELDSKRREYLFILFFFLLSKNQYFFTQNLFNFNCLSYYINDFKK
ncbi:hypothetical protein ABPG72_005687 [Tetrahymena utriculariae]